MGGLDNSFLIKDGSVEVFRNVNDGVKKSEVRYGRTRHARQRERRTLSAVASGRYPDPSAAPEIVLLTPLQPLKSSS
eukprot:1182212-Prorocentrum_minimum.AAC.3